MRYNVYLSSRQRFNLWKMVIFYRNDCRFWNSWVFRWIERTMEELYGSLFLSIQGLFGICCEWCVALQREVAEAPERGFAV